MGIDKALSKITHGMYVLGARDKVSLANGRLAGSMVDAVMQAATMPLMVAVSCNKTSYTRECIMENGKFSLSVLGKEVEPLIVANFGFQTSRKVDKWKNVAYYEADGLPYLKDNIATLACEVFQTIVLESHTVFLAKAVDGQEGIEGEPLTYKEYHDGFKNKVMQAFKTYNENKGEK